jgi:hypothetical protein
MIYSSSPDSDQEVGFLISRAGFEREAGNDCLHVVELGKALLMSSSERMVVVSNNGRTSGLP